MPVPTRTFELPLRLAADPLNPGQVLAEHRALLATVRTHLDVLELQRWGYAIAHEMEDFPEGVRLGLAVKESALAGDDWTVSWRVWLPGTAGGFNPDVVGRVGRAQDKGTAFNRLVAPSGVSWRQWDAMVDALEDLDAKRPSGFTVTEMIAYQLSDGLDAEPSRGWTAHDFRNLHEQLLSQVDLALVRAGDLDDGLSPPESSAPRPGRL